MRIVIVTGMSGAGKTTALKIFEDAGYYCVDNLPPALMGQFAELFIKREMGVQQVALGIDIRGGKLFDDFSAGLADLDSLNIPYSILFLDSSNDILVNRYKETRHLHPLAKNDIVSVGIARERVQLEDVKQSSSYIIDTSHLLPRHLKEKILRIFNGEGQSGRLLVNILSFGFKYGMPDESDLVFDVRFLPNPFYNPDLKEFSGLDLVIKNYVMSHDVSTRFMESLLGMLHFLIPHYITEGKSQLIVSIGCTGGRHRSVTLASELFTSLEAAGQHVAIHHRDIDKVRTH